MAVIISEFTDLDGIGVAYFRNGVVVTDGAITYYLTETEDIDFIKGINPVAIYNEQNVIFTSPSMVVQGAMLYGSTKFIGNTTINEMIELGYQSYYPNAEIVFNGNVSISASLTLYSGYLRFSNGTYNFNNITWLSANSSIEFGVNSVLNITSSSKGKTLLKGSSITGTISLDVEDDVQDGDTFLIEATDNQLVITDGEWTATPSTSGNITTYTLSKATLQKPKFRLLYTVG